MLRKFDSGVRVIQNKSHSDEEVIFVIFMSCYILILQGLFMFKKGSPFFVFSFYTFWFPWERKRWNSGSVYEYLYVYWWNRLLAFGHH